MDILNKPCTSVLASLGLVLYLLPYLSISDFNCEFATKTPFIVRVTLIGPLNALFYNSRTYN